MFTTHPSRPVPLITLLLLTSPCFAGEPASASQVAAAAARIEILLEPNAADPESRVANVLRDRILKRSQVAVTISRTASTDGQLRIYLRRIGQNGAFDKLYSTNGLRLPGKLRQAPESLALKTVKLDRTPALLAMGADQRGLLYAVGEILRQLTFEPSSVELGELDLRLAPAYRFRGSSANQGGTMMQITGARPWTTPEYQDYTLDLALSGANCFYASGSQFDFVKSFGLLTVTGCRPNELTDFPKAWQASERGNWVCPSIPEARKALLEKWDKDFAQRQDHDILRFYAGDPGGCRCPRCEPWGKTFVVLCEEVAGLWLMHHPNSIVQIANQDLSNAGDQAIFDYLNEKPRPWLEGIAYGPGSSAMSKYFRNELREDLFEYPGSGPINRYLAEILNQLPKYQHITHYSDITHWISAQYHVAHPEPHLVKIYGRRTFHARPKAFYAIFQAIMPFSEGDIIYSEGSHDEFHQYLWNRLLWNPNRTLEDVTDEYCRFQFGAAAVPEMREALFQLEQNLELPLDTNPGIQRYYALVKSAGPKIPVNLFAIDYRWRLHMEKAALDRYFQLKLLAEQTRLEALNRALASSQDPAARISAAQAVLAEPLESAAMAALREEAGKLGQETDQRFGIRNVGYFSTNKPLTDLAWSAKQVERAAAASDPERGLILQTLLNYESVGPGSFYDDAGNPERQPHLIKGSSFDASAMLDPNNRPSQNTIAYNLNEAIGVVFRYTGLDSAATYKLRLTLVTPRVPKGMTDIPRSRRRLENILANGQYLAKGVELPEYTARQFEYAIPHNVTENGVLELSFERGEGSAGTAVSEVWLLKQ